MTFCHMPFEIVANCQESGKILPVCQMQVEILAVFYTSKIYYNLKNRTSHHFPYHVMQTPL